MTLRHGKNHVYFVRHCTTNVEVFLVFVDVGFVDVLFIIEVLRSIIKQIYIEDAVGVDVDVACRQRSVIDSKEL